MHIDPFFQVPQHTVATSVGNVDVPIFVQEGDYCIAFFLVRRERLLPLLASTELKPSLNIGKYSMIALGMADFTHCSEDPFRMVAASVPVHRNHGPQPRSIFKEFFAKQDHRYTGFYTFGGHADNGRMGEIGAEIWGLPKGVGPVGFDLEGGQVNCDVRCAYTGEDVMSFSGKGGRFLQMDAISYHAFSINEGNLFRSLINNKGQFHLHMPLGYRLRVGSGNQQLAQQLRWLGLDGSRPLIMLCADNYQCRFHEGAVVQQISTIPRKKPESLQKHLIV